VKLFTKALTPPPWALAVSGRYANFCILFFSYIHLCRDEDPKLFSSDPDPAELKKTDPDP